MAEIYKDSLLRENEEEYKKRGYTKLGFEREMLVPYKFLEELEAMIYLKFIKILQFLK